MDVKHHPPEYITFTDLKVHNDNARKTAGERVFMLEQQEAEDKRLPPELVRQLEIYRKVVKEPVVDPLFLALRAALVATSPELGNVPLHDDGKFRLPLSGNTQAFMAIYGLLEQVNAEPRDFEWDLNKEGPYFKTDDPEFKRAVTTALGDYSTAPELFLRTLWFIADAGNDTLSSDQWTNVAKKLQNRGIGVRHPNLKLVTEELLTDEVSAGDDAAPSSVDLSFPVIEDTSSLQFIKNNILAMHIFYPSWMLEQCYFYDVYEKIEELFLNQMLPVSRGSAGDKIYSRWKKSTQRISKSERLNFYASCFGAAYGNPAQANQNSQFADIWLRFVSGVSEWARKLNVDDLLRTRIPLSVSTEQVRKSARDLAANLSLHGYGVAYFAAAELQNEINEIKDILSDPEVRMAYGARDMRQLIEQVSIYELGGARDVTRYFTMATAGAIIIRWLANKAADLSGAYMRPILDVNVVRKPSMRRPTVLATKDPTDRDLVDACEQWLAVTGTSDDRVTEFAQPSETAAMTSRPVSIPQVAKDLLDTVGISAGMGTGNGGTKSRFNPHAEARGR